MHHELFGCVNAHHEWMYRSLLSCFTSTTCVAHDHDAFDQNSIFDAFLGVTPGYCLLYSHPLKWCSNDLFPSDYSSLVTHIFDWSHWSDWKHLKWMQCPRRFQCSMRFGRNRLYYCGCNILFCLEFEKLKQSLPLRIQKILYSLIFKWLGNLHNNFGLIYY